MEAVQVTSDLRTGRDSDGEGEYIQLHLADNLDRQVPVPDPYLDRLKDAVCQEPLPASLHRDLDNVFSTPDDIRRNVELEPVVRVDPLRHPHLHRHVRYESAVEMRDLRLIRGKLVPVYPVRDRVVGVRLHESDAQRHALQFVVLDG